MLESFLNAWSELSVTELVLLIVFGFIYFFRLIYLIIFTGRVAYIKPPTPGAEEPVAIISVFRNEEENLKINMPVLLSFKKEEYEVIAVDDFSMDNSLTVLGLMKENNSKLRITSLNQETRFSEKVARNIAIKGARHEWVVSVPPSAVRFGSEWLEDFSCRLNKNINVLIGYTNVEKNGTWQHLIFRIIFFFQQLKSFEFTVTGMPFVVSEENVVFRKKKYFETGGYGGKLTESFANLEFVINTFIDKKSTLLHLSEQFTFRLNRKINTQEIFELLIKEIKVKKHLSFWKRFFLTISDTNTLLLLPVTLLIFIFLPVFIPLVSLFLLAFALAYSLIIKKILTRLDESKLLLPSLLLALVLPYFELFFRAFYHNSEQKKRWKGKK